MTIEAQLTRIADALEKLAAQPPAALISDGSLDITATQRAVAPVVAAVPVVAVIAQPRRGRPPKTEAVAGQTQPEAPAVAAQAQPASSPQATTTGSTGTPQTTDASAHFLTSATAPVTKEAVLAALEAAVGRATTRLGNTASAHKEVFKVFQTVSGEESLPALVKNAPEKFAAVIAAAEAVK